MGGLRRRGTGVRDEVEEGPSSSEEGSVGDVTVDGRGEGGSAVVVPIGGSPKRGSGSTDVGEEVMSRSMWTPKWFRDVPVIREGPTA